MSPIHITFKRQLPVDCSWQPKTITDRLTQLQVSSISITDRGIEFKNNFFNRNQHRGHLMATVDAGHFTYEQSSNTLIYQFSMQNTLIVSLVLSTILSLFAGSFSIFLIFFAWFFGMNGIIALIRHYLFLKNLVSDMR